MSDLTRPDTRIEENLRLEIKRLKDEIERLTAHLGRVVWGLEDASNELSIFTDLTLSESKIVNVLLDGHWHSYEHICGVALRENTLPKTVAIHLSRVKDKLPWIEIEAKRGFGCRMSMDSIKRIRQMTKVEL